MTEATDTKVERSVVGRVVSNKGDKTITVVIERRLKHALYGKYISRQTKVHAHDEDNTANEGDTVKVVMCRPISKLKCWRLAEVLEQAAV